MQQLDEVRDKWLGAAKAAASLEDLEQVRVEALGKKGEITQFMKTLGGLGPDHENLTHMKATADRLFGKDYYLSVLAAGRHQLPFVTMGAILGGNVRVGLEDSLYAGKGKLATSNAEQVAKIRRILEELSLEIATPAEARAMLGTKGGDNVNF